MREKAKPFHWLKKLLLLIFITTMGFVSNVFGYSSSDWYILSEGNCDGSIEFFIKRYKDGNKIKHNLYLEYRDASFQWVTIAHIYHWKDGNNKYWCKTYKGATDYDYDPDGPLYAYVVSWEPDDELCNAPITFRVRHEDDQVDIKTATAFKPEAPANVQTTTDECGQVTVTWDNPTNLGSYTNWTNRVYRGSSYKTVGQGESYTYTGGTDGQEYDYKVRTVLTCDSGEKNYGIYSAAATGNSIGPHDSPTNVQASTDQCDGTINITWEWNSVSPDNFQLQRSTSQNSGYSTLSSSISGAARFYEDTPPSKETTYYYRMRTKNECGDWGSYAAVVSGKAPDVPPAPTNVAVTALSNKLRISWNDNATTETGFLIKRSLVGGGAAQEIDGIAANSTYYDDEDITNCQSYTYEVFAVNDCGENSNDTKTEGILLSDISNTFTDGSLVASKGYYSDKVYLEWTNSNLINSFKIYRKIAGSNNTASLVATLNSNSSIWIDTYAEAGIIYEYTIQAEGPCENETIVSNTVSDLGFRTAAGIVSGHVDYEGGNAVEGVQVLVERSTGATGSALEFDGNDYVSISHSDLLMPANELTLECMVKPSSLTSDMNFVKKSSGSNGYGLKYNNAGNAVVFWLYTSNGYKEVTATGLLETGSYSHVLGTYDGTNLYLYVDGEKKGTQVASGTIVSNSAAMLLGSAYKGIIDEILVWNVKRTRDEVEQDYTRILSGEEDGLVAYWRADENVGDHIFDCSKTGDLFNENHGDITGAQWTEEIPSNELLGLKGITDENGNYIINNIRYTGTGNNFKLTPFYGQHTFDPGNTVLYIGEGASVHNNQDFTDISSFKVTGTVKYDNTSCYAKDIYLYIDGELVVENGQPVQTDASGYFEIDVPIGHHSVSVGKNGHGFSPGTWPTDGSTWNFQEAVSGIEFIDTTLITVVGRVVGGTREGDKEIGFDLSTNNIGQAEITFRSEQLNGCSTQSVTTDYASGEYTVQLPPLKYIIENLNIPSNPGILFEGLEVLDLSTNRALSYATDSVFVNNVFDHIDTVAYHLRQDYIYRVDAELSVTDKLEEEFSGDTVVYYTDNATGDEIEINVKGDPLGFPIFTQDQRYTLKFAAFENYKNLQTGLEDHVPVTDGIIRINNDLGKSPDLNTPEGEEIINLSDEDGDTLYTFVVGPPNVLIDGTYPEYSYTKPFKVNLEVGAKSSSWKPGNTGSGDDFFRGYVFGAKARGNNFATEGPQVVQNILRDPPGSGSYAAIEEGTSHTFEESWKLDVGYSQSMEATAKLGTKMEIGGGITGPAIETDISVEASVGTEIELSIGVNGEYKQTFTTTETWQTSSAPELVGVSEDLYIGKSQNFIYGLTDNLNILPNSACEQGGGPVYCSDSYFVQNQDTFRIGKRLGMFVVPGGFETMFIYSQDHIENYLIPDLELLRNGFFLQQPDKYVSNINASHANYGTNNDDPVWDDQVTSDDPVKTEDGDYDGPSYTFTPPTNPGDDEVIVDSIRWYNQQIRLWKEAMARNEKLKLNAEHKKNVSFDAGSTYTYEHESSFENKHAVAFEFGMSQSTKQEIGVEIGGAGASLEYGTKVEMKTGASIGFTGSESHKYTYVLNDGDQGDFFSVDVKDPKDGTGPVFKTVGGQSMCPWESEVVTKYYEPLGTVLSEATMRREIPVLGVAPNVVYDVPEDEAAVFNLSLGNESATDDVMWYRLKVIEGTNPHGAVIKVDGLSANRVYEIPPGETFNKTVTLQKAPGIDDYENIQLILYSPCEWEYHTNGGIMQAVDTVTISAHFIPACSDIDILSPDDFWVVNSSNNDSLDIVMGSYDVNYNGLEKFQLQYKSTSSANWIGLETYYKDTTGMNDPKLKPIPTDNPWTVYTWDMSQIIDGNYNLRAVTTCPLADDASDIYTGLADRINPHPFGSPQPADGILSPNDEISIQFNETINGAMLTWDNFDVRGVLNGTALNHETSIHFDGINDYVKIPDGFTLTNKSFSLEFWLQRDAIGEQCIISQGQSADKNLYIGFNATNNFVFGMNNQLVATPDVYTDDQWHHWVASYDIINEEVQIFYDGELVHNVGFTELYNTSGEVIIGSRSYDNTAYFNGNIHELRLWDVERSQAEIVANMNNQLTGKEFGLVGNWRMEEAIGSIAKDRVHSRHGILFADWEVQPQGWGYAFNGTDEMLEVEAATLAFTEETDITIEFWFKSGEGANTCLLSTGKGDGTDFNTAGWSINTNEAGNIIVNNNGISFEATNSSYFDNDWHHFALVVRRLANTSCYIDGELQNSILSDQWTEWAGAKLWMGSRGWYEGPVQQNDQFFNGTLDELRIWKLSRKQTQIQQDMNNRLSTDEIGLKAYFPFEEYTVDAGIPVLSQSIEDQSENSYAITSIGAADFTIETPNIKLPRPVQKVNFTYSVNNDMIILTTTDPDYLLENCILDITVQNVYDMNGNVMQSPETWSAYMDRNQMKWEENQFSFVKERDKELTFSTYIVNASGQQETYAIDNVPDWLTVSPQTGTIEPDSKQLIEFTISDHLNNGSYNQDIYLITGLNFSEKLSIDLQVYTTQPNWDINPADYQYSMNIIGRISIEDVISTDVDDMLAVYKDGVCRGVANLEYVEAYDAYLLFMNVYSNSTYEYNLRFEIWDASEGKRHGEVTPYHIRFESNDVQGTPASPITFNGNGAIVKDIVVNEGWNWISFNMESDDLADVDVLLDDIDAAEGDLMKAGNGQYAYYRNNFGWFGSLGRWEDLRNTAMFKLKVSSVDTINYTGVPIDPESIRIPVYRGWNWISFIPEANVLVEDAFAELDLETGDIVKSQHAFAMYDENLGWIGNLNYMSPNQGYILYVNNSGSFTYPDPLIYNKNVVQNITTRSENWTVNEHDFEYNMTLLGKINDESDVELSEDIILGAFVNNECRGYTKPIYLEEFGEWYYFITIFENEIGGNVSFKLANEANNEVFEVVEATTFSPDSMCGSMDAPFILTVNTTSINENGNNAFGASLYPNPFSKELFLNVDLTETEELTVNVYNVLLQRVSAHSLKLEAGKHNINLSELIEAKQFENDGTYIITVKGKDKYQQFKVVKIK